MGTVDDLTRALTYCGFHVRPWKGERVYLAGYGRDIKAYLTPDATKGVLPADGWHLTVTSSWRMPRYNGLRCKGVKHAILTDLFVAGLISAPPPPRWQDVDLEAPLSRRPTIKRFDPEAPPALTVLWPQRRSRDPYAALRALHEQR